jgi:hypothetical protein
VRALGEHGADVNTPDNDGATPVFIAAQEGQKEVVRTLAMLKANVETPRNDDATPVFAAAQNGHADVVRVLASFKADITKATNNGWTPLAISAFGAHFEATKALLLLGAPVTIKDLKQHSRAPGDTRQLRADLQAWAADALVQHRIFHDTFLFGCSAHPSTSTIRQTTTVIPQQQPNLLTATYTSESPPERLYDASGTRVTSITVTTLTPTAATTVVTHTRTINPCLPTIAGVPEPLERIAAFAGIVVGTELRLTRAMGPAIAAIDWAAHDQPW